MKVVYTNAASIRNKWAELLSRPDFTQADIIALTETWLTLNDHIPNDVTTQYHIYRQDRHAGLKGGGTLLLIRQAYAPLDTGIFMCSHHVDLVTLGLSISAQKVLLACVYRGPTATHEEDQLLLLKLEECRAYAHRILIIGDFNLPEIEWDTGYAPMGSPGMFFLEWLHTHSLHQHITAPTRFRGNQKPSLLDLIISPNGGDISNILVQVPLGKSDHGVVIFTLHIKKAKQTPKWSRNFSSINHESMIQRTSELDWHSQTTTSVEAKWEILKANLKQIQDEFAPLTVAKRQNKPRWWRPSFKKAMRRRDLAWKKYKEARTSRNWAYYKMTRNAAVSLQRNLKKAYERQLPRKVRYNPKVYYGYVQSKRALKGGIGTLRLGNESLVDTDQGKAEVLKEYFSSVHREDKGLPFPRTEPYYAGEIPQLVITEDLVLNALKDLKLNKAPGPDGIHPDIVRPIAREICTPVTLMFRQSLEDGRVPTEWKEATVVPIHKGGHKNTVGNYRPISLTCILCKALETIIRAHICQHLTTNGLISTTQHGFIKGRSCLTNLISFLDEVTKRLDEGIPVEVCYIDFSKAFDSVNHRLLLNKLSLLGISGSIHRWIEDFLTLRHFKVCVGQATSTRAPACSGVPQGSILGPLLFLIFINDLLRSFKCPAFAFADDIKIVSSMERQMLESDIEKLVKWTQLWDLPLNAAKCHVLTQGEGITTTIGENDVLINPSTEVKDLGVRVTSNFKWNTQCKVAAQKARGELFRLRSALTCREPAVFIPLYKAFVRPHLEYCVQAWAPYFKKDIAVIEQVQRLATRMLPGMKHIPYEDRLDILGMFSMERRRLRGDLIETFKMLRGLSSFDGHGIFQVDSQTSTRGHPLKLKKPHVRLQTRANFFSIRVINAWNKLPESLVSLTSVNAFKRALDIS